MNTCETPNQYFYFSFIIGIIINIFIIYTLINIEKNIECKCSNNSRKQLLKEWFIFILFFNILFLFLFLISNYECYDVFYKDNMNVFFLFLLFIIQIIMLIRLFIYMKWLKDECKCSYGTEEKIIYWYLIIIFIILVSTILLSILLLLIINLLLIGTNKKI